MVLLIKQCGHVYVHLIFITTFLLFVCLFFGRFLVKKIVFFVSIYNCVCKFDEDKKKKKERKRKKKEIKDIFYG